MNNANWVANDWNCNRAQAIWSQSFAFGSSEPTKIKSKGNPSFTSNAALEPSVMRWSGVIGQVAYGNPLDPTYFAYPNRKWGKDATKWSDLTERPEPFEKSAVYEGEIISSNCIILEYEVPFYFKYSNR